MKRNPHVKALADLLVGVVLREMKNATTPDGNLTQKEKSDSDFQKENAPERGALPNEFTT